ncbi:sirohydrochlorin chelatase [Pelagicoccus mobilis]|nr:CbiX/SirB N-terminal domain-containing protein [Pelagicoccus mobilis]
MMENQEECIVLLDNGSLRPDSVRSLRRIAAELEGRIGKKVHPVSLLHSSKIPAEDLDGQEAATWRRFLRKSIEEGVVRFRVVPLFFGPSSAVVDYMPKVTAEVAAKHGAASVEVAGTLIDPARENEDGIAVLLRDLLIRNLDTVSLDGVVLVDHGSPLPEVAACRDLVGRQLAELLKTPAGGLIASSMERREGEEYDFCEPLLERALGFAKDRGWKRVALSQLFFSPGRHAGPGGDIAQIVADSELVREGGEVLFAPLVGESPMLADLLEQRYREAFGASS